MNQKKVLNLYTSSYPYGWGESYLNTELDIIREKFDIITLFPLYKTGDLQRSFTGNIRLGEVEIPDQPINRKSELAINKILFFELSRTNNPVIFFKTIRYQRALLKKAFAMADFIKSNPDCDKIHYSFWMNDWALALAILKSQNVIGSFFIRVNGFDIYDERHDNGFIPFRNFILKHVTKVFCVSAHAKNYIENKFGCSQKLDVAHFGTSDHGEAHFPSGDKIRVYSNARLIPLKNVMQIASSLVLLNKQVEWLHQGEGEGLSELESFVQKYEDQIIFHHGPILKRYDGVIAKEKDFQPHFLISLSKSEGIPVSMLEALSLGIPLIVTNVGGCSELITPETGILLSAEPTNEEVVSGINRLLESPVNSPEGHAGIKEFWRNNFSAHKNYAKLGDELLKSINH